MKERIHKIKSDFGMKDYYDFYTKEYKDSIKDKKLYNKIINEYNEKIQDLIINENLIYFIPYLNLEIILKKELRKPRIVNGKLINNIPPNWKATNELWEKDPEAKEKKLLVRYNNSHTSGFIFRIYCKKFKSKIKNKHLYKFKPSRKFKRKLATRIKDKDKDNLNAYLLW